MRLVGAVVVAVLVAAVSADEGPVVNTQQGRVAGVKEKSTKGKTFYSFYRIPFAKPPVGELRFKDPLAADRWKGVLDGSSMPEPCGHVPFGSYIQGGSVLAGVEDCLYLNVFTPEPMDEDRKLPVMVWIHGGGFSSGGAKEYLPHVLLDHDIVLVVIQYRLGMMGFLSTEDSVIPGNFGLKDQTMALHWVQTNIHSFGGDKTRVTIFGESAGGASVHYHILSPKSEGLFSRAILQSGTALCPWALGKSHADVTKRVAQAFGCSTQENSVALLACLQSLDSVQLTLYAYQLLDWFMFPMLLNPRVDGDFLLEEPSQLLQKGIHSQVDLMSGVTEDEGGILALFLYNREELKKGLETNFSVTGPASLQCNEEDHPTNLALKIYQKYLGEIKFDETQSENVVKMFSDRLFSTCHEWTTLYHARNQHPSKKTYRYTLQHHAEQSLTNFFSSKVGKKWIVHGDDLYYLFRGGPLLQPDQKPEDKPRDLQRQEDLALRDTITTLWTNFASTGNPTPDDSLGFIWEPSTEDNLHYLALKPQPTMEPDQRQESRRFHASLPTRENRILHPHLVQEELPAGREEL